MAKLSHTHRRAAAGPKVQPATMRDLDEIVALNAQLRLPGIREDCFPWDKPEWVADQISEGNFYVTRDRKGITGAISVEPGRRAAELETMVVRQDMRHAGIGRVLVNHAIATCRKEGIGSLYVGSFCDYGVKGFYESCGFTCDGVSTGPSRKPFYSFSMDIQPAPRHQPRHGHELRHG